ncbi:hypothetical protein MG1_02368 [Candida albicans GC75]|nr:hypothetical protein MG1_02368 [Candida albicans GC75]
MPSIDQEIPPLPSSLSPSSPSIIDKISSVKNDHNNRTKLYSIYSLDQVKIHDKPNDLWMILYNKVYDITNFTSVHPGDVEVLLDCGGADATEAFEDVGHSDFAFQMLKPYLIGELQLSDQKKYESKLLSARKIEVTSDNNNTNGIASKKGNTDNNGILTNGKHIKTKKTNNNSNNNDNITTKDIHRTGITKSKKKRRNNNKPNKIREHFRMLSLGILALVSLILFLYIQRFRWLHM